jgi:hypothetical protein
MNPLEFLSDALRNLASNKLRSSLTMMGVVIGVAAVIAMSSIVEGGKKLTVDMIEKMGTHLLSVRPKKLDAIERRAFPGRSRGLRMQDALWAQAQIPYVQAATPVVNISAQLRHSMTYNQGRAMSPHKLFTQDAQMIVYFAHPHSPWERGTNENINGLLRLAAAVFPQGISPVQNPSRGTKSASRTNSTIGPAKSARRPVP